jgi:two-component system sensor histidine kinase BaeS
MNRLWVRLSLAMAGVIFLLILIPVSFPLWETLVEFQPTPAEQLLIESLQDQLSTEQILQFRELARDNIIRGLTYTLIGGGVLSLGMGLWMSRTLAAPLSSLAAGAQEIEAQNFAHRVPVAGTEEMMTVAASFNRMAAELEQSEQLRRNLLADVAHELRNPLHVLQGNLQAILDGVYPLSEEEISRLLTQTSHLITLVQDLHELAQAEAHQLTLNKQNVHIGELVKGHVLTFQSMAQRKGVQLQTELLGKLPTMPVDSGRMRQVLNNLIDNALRHTPENGQIIVTAQQLNGGVQIRVSDTGAGIAAEDLPYIFDRFYRADKARTRETGGAGLGLAIVKAIVEAHDGYITVTSDGKNRGTTFAVNLPVVM